MNDDFVVFLFFIFILRFDMIFFGPSTVSRFDVHVTAAAGV